MIHHYENPPVRQSKHKVQDDLLDRYLPELLFFMEELRGLVRKYNQVIQRYFVQYLSGYDAVALKQCIQVKAFDAVLRRQLLTLAIILNL